MTLTIKGDLMDKKSDDGWYQILKHNDRIFVNGRRADTVTIGGVELEIGKFPRKTHIWLREIPRKKIWEDPS